MAFTAEDATKQLQLIRLAGEASQSVMLENVLHFSALIQKFIQSLAVSITPKIVAEKVVSYRLPAEERQRPGASMERIESINGCFIDHNNQKVSGGPYKVFINISKRGQCIFVDRFGEHLLDADGNAVDGASLQGQYFLVVNIKFNVPYELYPAEVMQQISKSIQTSFWSNNSLNLDQVLVAKNSDVESDALALKQ